MGCYANFRGRIVKDLELKKAGSADVVNFIFVVNGTYDGKDKASFFEMTAFGKMALTLSSTTRKGTRLYIESKPETYEFISEGKKITRCKFIITKFEYLDLKPKEEKNYNKEQPSNSFGVKDDLPF